MTISSIKQVRQNLITTTCIYRYICVCGIFNAKCVCIHVIVYFCRIHMCVRVLYIRVDVTVTYLSPPVGKVDLEI